MSHTSRKFTWIISFNTPWSCSVVKNLSANAEDAGLIPGWGRSPGEGNGNPLQYSCLENSMDRGACGLQKSQTRLSDWTELKLKSVNTSQLKNIPVVLTFWIIVHFLLVSSLDVNDKYYNKTFATICIHWAKAKLVEGTYNLTQVAQW